MPKKYRTPNGLIVDGSELQAKYGDKFNSLLENNTFTEINENIYKTPNGKYATESDLKTKYGDRFNSLIENNTFTLDEPVKKKDIFDSTEAQTNSELVGEETSLVTQEDNGIITLTDEQLDEANNPGFGELTKIREKADKDFLAGGGSQSELDARNKALYGDGTYSISERKGLGEGYGNDKPEAVEIDGFDNKKMIALNERLYEEGTLSQEELTAIDADIQRKKNKDYTFLEKIEFNFKSKSAFEQQDWNEVRKETIKSAIQQKQSDFFKSLDPDEVPLFESYISKRNEKLSDEFKIADSFNEKLSKAADIVVNNIKDVKSKINEIATKENPTKEDEVTYNNLVETHNLLANKLGDFTNQYEVNRKTLINSQDDLLSFESELGLAKRDYGFYANNIKKLGHASWKVITGASDFIGGAAIHLSHNVASHIAEQMDDESVKAVEETFNGIEEGFLDVAAKRAKDAEKFDNSIALRRSFDSVNSVSDLGEYTSNLLIEQVPILATLYLTGGVGLGIVSSSSGGQKLEELAASNRNPIMPTNHSMKQMMGTATMFAAGEYVGESITLGILKDYKRLLKAGTKTGVDRASFKEGIKNFVNSSVKFGTTANKEGLSEVYTGFIQNVSENVILDSGKGLFDDFKENYASGAVMGGGIHVLSSIKGAVSGEFALKANRTKVGNNVKEILKYQKLINSGELNDYTKQIYQEKIQTLTNENNSIINLTDKTVENLKPIERNQITAINSKIKAIQQALKNTKSDTVKKELLAEIQNLSKEKDGILEKAKNNILENQPDRGLKVKEEATNQLVKEHEGEKEFKITDEQVTEKAIEILTKEEKPVNESETQTKETTKQEVETATPNTEVEQKTVDEKVAEIERRRQEELDNRVLNDGDTEPTAKDGEFKILGDNRLYRINESTGRPQVFENGFWSNTELAPKLFFHNAKRTGWQKSKEQINAKYDAEIEKVKNEAQEKGNTPTNEDVQPNIEPNIQQGKDSELQSTKNATTDKADVEVDTPNQEKNTNFDDIADFLNEEYINPKKETKDSKVEIKEKLKVVKKLIDDLPNGEVKSEMLKLHKNPKTNVTVEVLDNTINNFDEIVKNANKNIERINKNKADEKPRKNTKTKTNTRTKTGSVQENSSLDQKTKREVQEVKDVVKKVGRLELFQGGKNAKTRQEIIHKITGKKPTLAKSGITVFKKVLAKHSNAPQGSNAAIEEHIINWANNTPKKAKKPSLRGKTPLDKRKIKDKTMLASLKIEVDNAYDIVLQYFISGGRMTSDGLKEVIATGGNLATETRSRSQYIRTTEKGGISFNDIVHSLWQKHGKQLNIEDTDFRDALINVLSEHLTPKAMAIHLTEKHNVGKTVNESGEELIDTPMGKMTQEELDDLILYEESKKLNLENHEDNLHILDALTDAEIIRIDEEKDLAFDDFIKELDAKEQSTKNTVQVEPTTEVHKDYGEKIGGARKDIYNSLDKIDEEDIRTKPLSKSFPEPDYNKLVEDGTITKDGAKILKFVYQNIPSKPRAKHRVNNWVRTVENAIELTKDLINNKDGDFTEKYAQKVSESKWLKDQWEIFSKTMDGLGFPAYNPPKTKLEVKKFSDGRIAIVNGHFIVQDFKSIDDAVQALKVMLIMDSGKKKVKVDLGVYQNRTTKDVFIGKKTATGIKRVVEGFKTVKEAHQYLKENRLQVEGIWNDLKVEFNERREYNRDRKGTDWRKGKNISTEEFAKTFGFRGVEYGNWVNNNERQKSVNDAYDALMDLASVLNISPESLSLNGSLALAFGARGKGTAMAHYEADKVVINLTKKKGAGSLAHEWFHGLDNYISRLREKKSDFITNRPRVEMVRNNGMFIEDTRIRKELLDAFNGLVKSIRDSKLKERSENLDSTKSKLYWSTTIEMAARSFENYIIEKLGNNNEHNDYLANFKETTEWVSQAGLDTKNYPYPLKEESESINAAFDEVFETIGEAENFGKKEETTEQKLHNKVDKGAQWLKDQFPGIDDPNLKGQGYTQDQLIDLMAEAVKKMISSGIEINAAIKQLVAQIKDKFGVDINPNDVKARLEPKKDNKANQEKPPKKETPKKDINTENFRDKIKGLPNSGEFSKYLSGETIEREHSELRNMQDIEVMILEEVGNHGIETIELAKEIFGKKYIEKTLEYLNDSNLKSHEKAVIYVSLENEMHNRVTSNPNNVSEKKLQDLVRAKSQQHLREASLSINAGRLRAIMRDGYISDPITNKMYSKEQLEGKKKIQKAIESNMDAINDEAEFLENDIDLDFEIKEPRIKRSKKVVKLEIKDTLKKMRADLLRAAKGDVALSSIPYAAQLKAAAPHIIKLSKLLAELGGMKTREIINEIYDNLKEAFPQINKQDIADVIKENNKPKSRSRINPKVKQAKEFVKQALIEKGFSREINVRINKKDALGNIIKDENGRNKKVKERRTVLDWKKLAGEAGTIENIRENVQDVLKNKGYTDAEIENMSKEYEDEYNLLRASVIEKSLNELKRRNEVRKKIDIKSSAKRLAELFNYGLFEKETDTYNNLINSALGFNDLDNKSFKELESLAKTLADLYNQDVSEIGLQSSIAYVNKEIARTLSNAAFLQSNNAFKITSMVGEYINLSTRFLLVRLSQFIENPFSGYVQRNYTELAYALEKTDNKKLRKQRLKSSKDRFRSIVRDGGNAYGDTSSLLINDSKIENWLNRNTESELGHSIISFYMGRAFLEGYDSRHKTVLTEKYFVHNLINVLTHKSNPNKMSKEDALNFVTEKLTGQSFENAKEKARSITEKTNKDAGRKILNDNERSINIFAQDIMKDTLLEGEILTEDQIGSAYNAAYKTAGKDIGHVANNPVSKMVGLLNSSVEKQVQESIKEKDWNKAALYTVVQVFTRNILNTFVGGGTNWVVLGLQKSGIYGLPSLIYTRIEKGNKRIDLTTTQGIKDLEKILYTDLNYKNTASRVIIGSALSTIMVSLAVASGADDDIDEWLKNNKWAEKYFNKLAPEAIIALLAYNNGEMGNYFRKVFNTKSQAFDLNYQSAKSVTDLFSENENKGAEAGKLIGGKISFPAPYKFIKDVKDIYDGVRGEEVKKQSYKASGFWNGFFMGGLVDHVGLRPGESQVDLDLKKLMLKRELPSTKKTPEEKALTKEKQLQREAEYKKQVEDYNKKNPDDPIKYVLPKSLQSKSRRPKRPSKPTR